MIFWPNSWEYNGRPSARLLLVFRTEKLFGTPTVRSNSVKCAPCRNCLVTVSRASEQRCMNSSGICSPILILLLHHCKSHFLVQSNNLPNGLTEPLQSITRR